MHDGHNGRYRPDFILGVKTISLERTAVELTVPSSKINIVRGRELAVIGEQTPCKRQAYSVT